MLFGRNHRGMLFIKCLELLSWYKSEKFEDAKPVTGSLKAKEYKIPGPKDKEQNDNVRQNTTQKN